MAERTGIHVQEGQAARVVTSRAGARRYHASLVDGKGVERAMEPEILA